MTDAWILQPDYLAEIRGEGLVRGPDGLVHAWRTWRFEISREVADEDITGCGLELSWFEYRERGWVRLRDPEPLTCLLCVERGHELHQ